VPADLFVFGPFELDASARRLTKHGDVVPLPSRQFDLLHLLVARAGQVLSKDALIAAAWNDVAVTDNSLEQAISALRRSLTTGEGEPCIETQARRGYRFAADVRRHERREPAESLDALLAPHRAWIEGRAALETLERTQILHARAVFERVVAQVPDSASAHVGLANAGVMQFEMTRADAAPDLAALALAEAHAREACRLEPRYGEAWATMGFVLDRSGQQADALAASRMAVSLEPDNWRHHVRLAYVGWGEERLREARRTLSLLPGFPLAHWLAATVHVARHALDEAERELDAGVATLDSTAASTRFSSVALHWLRGLLRLARGDERGALAAFEAELAGEGRAQLYARECCANTWYAIGAVRLRHGNLVGAEDAFRQVLDRVPQHPLALAASQADPSQPPIAAHRASARMPSPVDLALATAVRLSRDGKVLEAAGIVEGALAAAPDGSSLWTLPIDPVLRTAGDPRWTVALARLRDRAA